MDVRSFRKQYPQYNDMQDNELIQRASARGIRLTATPLSPFETVARVSSGVMLPPFLSAAQKATSLMSDQTLEPTLGAMGATAGGMSRIPFGATLGATGGTALGRTLQEMRHGKTVSNAPLTHGLTAGALTLAGAGIGKAVSQTVKGVRGLPFFLSKANRLGTAQAVREGVVGATKAAGSVLEQSLGQIPGTVDLRNEIAVLSKAMQADPEVNALVSQGIQRAERMGDTTLLDLLTNPEAASSVDASRTQQVISTLKQSRAVANAMMRSQQLAGQGGRFLTQTPDAVMEVLSHENAILGKASQSLPESFGQARQTFADVARGQRELKPFLTKSKLIPTLSSGFPEELESTVQTVLPKQLARRALAPAATRQLAKTGAAAAAGTLGIAGLLKFLHGATAPDIPFGTQ